MKRILLIFAAALLAGACTSYETTVSGVQDGAFLKVVKIRKSENKFEDGVTLLIDEKRTTIEKVYSEKNSAKAMTTKRRPRRRSPMTTMMPPPNRPRLNNGYSGRQPQPFNMISPEATTREICGRICSMAKA